MRRILACLLILWCLIPTAAQAQMSTLANRNMEQLTITAGKLNTNSSSSPASAACKTVTVNASGVANAGIAVDNTAGGVTVMAASTTTCGAVLYNLQGGGDVLCGPSTIVVTTTVGFYLAAGQSLQLGTEGQEAWKCIRQGANNGTIYVARSTT